MKITMVVDSLRSGGKERQLLELLKGLGKKNDIACQLIILSPDIDYSYVYELNTRIDIIQRSMKKDPSVLLNLYKLFKDFKPDVIHTWELMSYFYSIPVARMQGVKIINGVIRNAPLAIKQSYRDWVIYQLSFRLADFVLANSYAGLVSYGAPRYKSRCIHNGFDFSRLENLQNVEWIRRRFVIGAPKVVGMVAKFEMRKDYKTFILAAMRILERRGDVMFVAVGDGPGLNESQSMVPPQYQDRIRFLGKQKEIESLVNAFDLGVLASYDGEGISNSIMEYMALGKPVVATEGGGTAEIVVDGRSGFLVEPENVDDMVSRIEYLLNHEAEAQGMGSWGKKRLFNEFGLELMVEKHIELYRLFVN
jgi:glycosyltransferase involved in cell wall biosynthesis